MIITEQCLQLACSFVCIQADELDGALVWRPAGLAVLHMLPLWTVSEGVAVSYQVDLVRSQTGQILTDGDEVVRS